MRDRMLLALVGAWLLGAPWMTTSHAEEESAVPEASAITGEVKRAVFARDVQDREPVGAFTSVPAGEGRVFFFTELVGLEGQTVRHVWQHDGETKADVTVQVRGPRWRVYSSKNLLPGWDGDWQVQVLTADGRVLHEDKLAVLPETASPEDAVPAAPDTEP